MSAVAGREPSEHDFIGQVFSKASPILTWRPVKVQRITPAPPAMTGDDAGVPNAEGGMDRISRATTKRMVAWPVVPRVGAARIRSRGPAVRALLTLVSFSLLCGTALTLCVYVLLGEGSDGGASHAKAPPVRVGVAHVADETFDTLLTVAGSAARASATSPLATAEPESAPLPAGPATHKTAAPHGRAHAGHKARRNEGVASHGT